MMSRLPKDHAYWDALTERLVHDAAGRLSAYRDATNWWHGLARYAAPLLAGATAAVIAALLWLPDVEGKPPGDAAAGLYGLAPNDPLAALLVTSTEAPTMATVMAISTLEDRP